MNKKVILIVAAVIVLGVLGVVLANVLAGPDIARNEIRTTEQVIDVNARTTPQPQANTFNVMSPEEKAAAEEAERLADEARITAELASTSASTSIEADAELDLEE